jgi:hypothetical protein
VQEAAWREDTRRVSNGEQVQRVAKRAQPQEVGGLYQQRQGRHKDIFML